LRMRVNISAMGSVMLIVVFLELHRYPLGKSLAVSRPLRGL